MHIQIYFCLVQYTWESKEGLYITISLFYFHLYATNSMVYSPKSSSTVCLYFLYIDVRNEDTFVLHTENSKVKKDLHFSFV